MELSHETWSTVIAFCCPAAQKIFRGRKGEGLNKSLESEMSLSISVPQAW